MLGSGSKIGTKIKGAALKLKYVAISLFTKVKEFVKKHKVIFIIAAVVLVILLIFLITGVKKHKQEDMGSNEVEVVRMTVSESISESSVISANDSYSVTPLVTGEVLEANFEEGDYVEKDQVLYVIDSSSVENSLQTAELSVEKAEINYQKALNSHTDDISQKSTESTNLSLQKAQNSYEQAKDALGDLTVSSDFTGTIGEVYVSVGDDVANGTKIADVADNTTLKVRVPFNTVDAERIWTGAYADVTLVSTGTVISGTVTAVSSGSETVSGGVRVSYVTIEVTNPGAVQAGDKATAMVDGMACNNVGEFEANQSRTILSKVSGKVTGVWVVKGDYVLGGSTIVTLESDSVDNTYKNADIALREAQLSKEKASLELMDTDDYSAKLKTARIALDEALLGREKVYKQLDDYTIKSPISGTVVAKNKKAGEKIEGGNSGMSSSSSSSSNVLAVIYDMSSLCVTIDVDELDIMKVETGQEARITADSVDGKTYTGVVENISINGTVGDNGVTTYPVKIRFLDADDNLLPGMNIDIEITVNKAENALAIPVNAVNRGNTVYVKGDKESDDDKAPEGYKTVNVEVGISNGQFIEVKSGLNEGDTVYSARTSSDSQSMMPGMMGGGMPGGGMPGGGMPGGGGMPSGGGNRSGGGGMPGGGAR